ncbi:PGLP2, partial [Symbiodinium natans]
ETSKSGYADAMAVSPIRDAKTMQYQEFVSYETYVFDCDGVLWGISDEDSKTSVGTVNHLLSLGKRVMFVTNNSNKTRAQFLQQLEGKGISFGSRSHEEKLSMMISASYTTAAYLQNMKLKRPFIITSDTGLLEECRLLGITDYFATIDDNGKTAPHFEKLDMMAAVDAIKARPHVDAIVVGWDMQLTASKVAAAVNYIKWHEDLHSGKAGYQELPLIACSSDTGGVLGKTVHMGQELKVRAIGNGAMADIIGRSFDPPKVWKDMGKPSEALIRLLRSPQTYNVDVSKTLMVGDTLQTDIVFGNAAGMKTLLVLTGVTSKEELDEEPAPCAVRHLQ